jgi:hypothetical protein
VKVLGKRELAILLNYRYKYNRAIAKEKKDAKEKAYAE